MTRARFALFRWRVLFAMLRFTVIEWRDYYKAMRS